MAIDRRAFRDRVLADLIAAPLRDPNLFEVSAPHYRASESANWDETEAYVRTRATAHQVDLFASDADRETAIEQAIARWAEFCNWQRNDVPGQYRVLAALTRAGRSLLHQSGRHMIPHICIEDPCREILRWRFVSLVLPPGIVMAAAADRSHAPAQSVRLLDRSFAPAGEVAELHVHHAAMSSFESVWASLHHTAIVKPGMLQRALRAKKAACPKLHSGACPVHASSNAKSLVEHAGHLAAWCDLLQQSFIARYLLRQHSWHTGKLLKECDECNRTNWQSNLRFFIRGQARPQYLRAVPYPWQGYRVALERRWREGTRPATSQVQRRSSDAVRYETADEQSFLIRALAYTRCSEGDAFNPPPIDDTEFESLLVQYLRIKTAVFRLLVHAPGEHGLVPFLTHFSQIKIYAPDAEKLRPQPRSEPGLSVAATEYRVAPDAWLNHHRRFTRAVEDRVVPRPVGEVAWLVHLKREKQVPKELPLFGTALRGFENDEDRIGRLIESYPETLRHLRGIDIAGVERHQPLWVSTDALRRLRKRADGIAGSSVKRGVQPLGLTLHVGEDFEWLTSGIRAVAEPIEWGMLTRGDRLGHAIAITSEPEKWWERRTGRAIETTRFERLLDLAFLAKYTDKLEEEESEKRTPEQETWLIAEISPLVSAIWPGLTTAQLPENPIEFAEKLWKALGSKSMHVLMNRRTSPGGSFPEAWLYRYLWNLSTRDRANHVIRLKVEPSPEIKLVMLARNRVIRQLSCRQICIESNPTSNLVVAGLDAIAAQKVLHHRFSQGDGSPKFRLPWTISTDDPISFSTSLADEYAYAWAGMALEFPEPCEPCDARALLDEAAATSMRMRFATPDDSGKDSNATRAPRSE